MQLVKLITRKKINALGVKKPTIGVLIILISFVSKAQDNSPYSRYGLGDIVPNTNILNRGMGGISAGFADFHSVNFSNPASYSAFNTLSQAKSKERLYSRVLLDIGIDYNNRSLTEPNKTEKFASNNLVFSYLQMGIPLRKNWGMSFGLRQLTRENYRQVKLERLFDPNTNLPIDSAITEYAGTGGAFLPNIGTGFAIKNLSIGVNAGYIFGKKETSTKRALINDTVEYNSGNITSTTSFNKLFFNAGLQYKINLKNNTTLQLGAFGNMKQELNASRDLIRETFVRDATTGDVRLDSVSDIKDIKGKIIYPSSYGAGFVLEQQPDAENKRKSAWLIGVDYLQSKWSEYRFYGGIDSVQNSWEIRTGFQFRPNTYGQGVGAAKRASYWSYVTYRAGFFIGQDYIKVKESLPLFGATFGMGLPIPNFNRAAQGQGTNINVSFEYINRGNNKNVLKENMFRLSVGVSLSDLWFAKKKYD